ncbi:MAG: hypothetical protein HFK09_05260 [Clostridia bacterium]|nr:hypothetical protein [Clostridia bacterium]
MLKKSIKNYFISLKYFFTPLGTMFLGMMLGLSVLIPTIVSASGALIDGVKELADHVSLDFNVLGENLWATVTALDWNDPVEAFKTMFSLEWIEGALNDALAAILGADLETFATRIAELIAMFTASLIAGVVVFFVFWILGFIAGYILIRFLIRRNIARRSIWKFILATVLNSVLSALLVVLCLWIYMLWQASIYISAVLVILLVGIFALTESYLMYGLKKVRFSQVVNFKNIGLYMLSTVIIFVISILLTLIALAINSLMGLFIGLSIINIAIIVVNLNADSYVQSVAAKADESIRPLFTPST